MAGRSQGRALRRPWGLPHLVKNRPAAGTDDPGSVVRERQGREGVSLPPNEEGSELAWEGGDPAWQHLEVQFSVCLTGRVRSECPRLNGLRPGPAARIVPHVARRRF